MVKGLGIVEVKPSLVKDSYDTAGTLRAVNTATVSAKIMGVVKAIHAREGQKVRKGDILLEISAPDINAKVKAASEAVEAAAQTVSMAREQKRLAEATFERFKGLYEGKAVSGQEFDEMKTRKRLAVLGYEQSLKGLGRAKAMLREAESFLGYTVIRSPLDGVAAEKMIDTGSMTTPGKPLFIVENGGYLVETPVSEGMINRIEEGETVEVTIDSLGIKTTGRVTTLVRQVDPATRTFTVKVRPDNSSKDFRGGLFARVAFPLKDREILLVPKVSVVKKGQMQGIYVVDDKGIINLRFIRTGREVDGRVEILSGLNKGERIVVSGTATAVDGGRIPQ